MISPLITKIEKSLSGQLPGRKAQELMAPDVRFAGHKFPDHSNSTPSGVLILIFPGQDSEWTTIFIERTPYGPHGGQISLPGGKREKEDISLAYTALRETGEEIGIMPGHIHILGELTPLYVPHSNFRISPFVGSLETEPELVREKTEVKSIIKVKLKDLFNPKNKGYNTFYTSGFGIKAPVYKVKGHLIWGATAMIISEFEAIIGRQPH